MSGGIAPFIEGLVNASEVKDCTTCRHHKHLVTLGEHLCRYPGAEGPISAEDVHKTNCPGWEPMEVAA